ncbi:MAG: 2Fe-2S iron-sulfur cluster-binding protein [Haloarculaceae archaeon]
MSGSPELTDDDRTDTESAAGEETYQIELHHRGETYSIEVGAEEYVLDAAEEAGLDMPYSCRMGQCTSCVGKLTEGELDQSEGAALDPMQEDDGYALLCVSYPESDCTIETEAQNDLFGMDI